MRQEYIKEIPREWSEVSAVFECLGDEQRQRILLMFEQGEELTAKDIVAVSDIKRTSIVHHLKKLESAGILKTREEGRFCYYSLNKEPILAALQKTIVYINESL